MVYLSCKMLSILFTLDLLWELLAIQAHLYNLTIIISWLVSVDIACLSCSFLCLFLLDLSNLILKLDLSLELPLLLLPKYINLIIIIWLSSLSVISVMCHHLLGHLVWAGQDGLLIILVRLLILQVVDVSHYLRYLLPLLHIVSITIVVLQILQVVGLHLVVGVSVVCRSESECWTVLGSCLIMIIVNKFILQILRW